MHTVEPYDVTTDVEKILDHRNMYPATNANEVPIGDKALITSEPNLSIEQCINFPSGQIQIKAQPRSKFRPRTEKESLGSAHYLRCEPTEGAEYPTIYV